MLPITLIILLIDVMPKFLLFYQLEYLNHNYSVQYLKLVSFLIGTMPLDSVITCLCEFWQSAIKQCYLQKEKSCLSVCLCILYARKQKIIYIFLCQADTMQAILRFETENNAIQHRRDKYFKTSRFEVFLEVELFFLECYTPQPGLTESSIWHMSR